MAPCIFCDNELHPQTRLEHILLNALGGRKTSRRLICTSHNEDFGSTIDKVLAEQVPVIRNLLQLDSGTGNPPPGVKNVKAGDDVLHIRGDGTVELVDKPFTINQRQDGSCEIQISARSAGHLAELIPNIAAKLKMPEQQLRDRIRTSQAALASKRPDVAHFELSFGGPDAIRSMMKSCLELWATVVGNGEVKSQPYDAARNFVLSGEMEFHENRSHLDARPLPRGEQLAARFGDIFNLIYVRSDGVGRVVGHFTLYNMVSWQMVLAECGGRPNVAVGLVSNPLDPGIWSDSIAADIEIDWDWLNTGAVDDFARAQTRIGAMMGIYSRKAMEREIKTVVKSVFERHKVVGDTVISDDTAKRQVFGEISRRAALLLLRIPHVQNLSPAEIEDLLLGGSKDWPG